MSLDVSLLAEDAVTTPERWAIFIREGGENKEITREEWDSRHPGIEPVMAKVGGETAVLYSRNVTHNLGRMADAAGIYNHLWRPDEIGITHAHQLPGPLSVALAALVAEPERFKRHNPANGWGSYEVLVSFIADYLRACVEHPNARVSVSR